jgi:hypothetical protein
MNRRQAFAVFGMPLLLSGCFVRSARYRYKLALSVDTPEGVKSGFSVGSVRHAEENGWGGRGGGSRTTGEALYLDLGPGNRPLVALLTRKLKPGERSYGTRWEEDSPTLLLARLYGQKQPVENVLDVVLRFAKYRGPSVITTADLPDLVTFADIIEPKSVLAVDPDNLPATCGGTTSRSKSPMSQ